MKEFDAAAHVEHMADLLGLAIDPAWKEGVVANMAATARMAGIVAAVPLDETVEPAMVFEP
ncbi:DUF4089 domain-containing protein [Kaistia geumhonensis]|uniref:Uncharacterized protein (DUF697 family) n=1 Tax=Kaistia geumhonensis TaxID=410839 RepID=A0ABU0MA26_9HYPH|nr:DUF4089 domain-containing protein [Kaistia geumhonensis]MCX5480474.1 DUF4089 domain-containing protein [Kaistia geumhonensis]MDQ0517826.1 uncharacterized protein (DUF697 family) [Kaistia geumhonensis]